MSVFAEPLARARAFVANVGNDAEPCPKGVRPRHEVLAALDLIEQRATDMEKALRQALDCKGPYEGTVSERGGEPAICTKCAETVRAALFAREEQK